MAAVLLLAALVSCSNNASANIKRVAAEAHRVHREVAHSLGEFRDISGPNTTSGRSARQLPSCDYLVQEHVSTLGAEDGIEFEACWARPCRASYRPVRLSHPSATSHSTLRGTGLLGVWLRATKCHRREPDSNVYAGGHWWATAFAVDLWTTKVFEVRAV